MKYGAYVQTVDMNMICAYRALIALAVESVINNIKANKMKKNQLTTVDQLQIGDRFYFQNDSNKVVWEIVEHETKTTHYRTYKHFCLLGSFADRTTDKQLRKHQSKGVQGNTNVVYLRSKEVAA